MTVAATPAARADRAAGVRAAPRFARGRAPFLVVAVAALLGGLWGALARLGLDVAAPATVIASHGALMSMGFLGTVIALERAVALKRRAAYAAPTLAAIGSVGLLVGLPFALWILAAGGLAFAITSAYMWHVRREAGIATMGVGGAAWMLASVCLALGVPISRLIPLVAAFLVLTIVGERLELSALTHPPAWSRVAFTGAAALVVVGAVVAVHWPPATVAAGIGLLALAAWLGVWDIAWRTVRRGGVTRYIAVALIAGYVWLAAGGITWVLVPDAPTMFAYDALIHTVFVGFVLSMIFAHELVIVPAVLGIALPFSRAFYAPLVLLHLSLAARIAGDVLGDVSVWQAAAATNVIAVLLFAAVTVASARGLLQPRTQAT
ncbi:MAG: hypothetical protein KGJ98_04970 [Chloroflexota bacterium]|nr:hypothetical protein [Chloroflexota bacterium]